MLLILLQEFVYFYWNALCNCSSYIGTALFKTHIASHEAFGCVQYLPKFYGTAARTDLVDCVHKAELVHSQKYSLANQRCVHLLLCVYARHPGFEREVPKICDRDCSTYNLCMSTLLPKSPPSIKDLFKYTFPTMPFAQGFHLLDWKVRMQSHGIFNLLRSTSQTSQNCN